MAAPPPAKRQRRVVVLSSDDEDVGAGEMSSTGLRTRSRSTKHSERTNARSSKAPSSSPEKDRKRKQVPANASGSGSQSLHAFFQPATEKQRWSKSKSSSRSSISENKTAQISIPKQKQLMDEPLEDIDDLIEDDYDSYDEIFSQHISGEKESFQEWNQPPKYNNNQGLKNNSSNDRRKQTRVSPAVGSSLSKSTASSKRFLLPNDHTSSGNVRKASPAVSESGRGESRPWAERYAPADIDELAVHKRKVTDVRNWLTGVFSGSNRRRLLVLRGPAGSGKTTTISLLSKAVGYDIVEWRNPLGSEYTAHDYTSMGAQFEEFLGRSDKFGSLDLDTTGMPVQHDSPSGRRIILIEEFPTVLSRTSPTLMAFRSSLQRYLAANSHPFLNRQAAQSIPPVVIVVSETMLGTSTSISDNFTVHRLLGPEICKHEGTSVIEFNPIAPTFMSKALNLVLQKETSDSKRTRIPGPAVLKQLSDMGDIRSAISSLEFLCVRGDESSGWGGRTVTKKKKPPGGVALTTMEKESLEIITQREASLGIFHAVGKVVYNKREDASLAAEGSIQYTPAPDHLRHHDRRKISQVSVNNLINETGSDIQTFICALHENYVPSCHGSSFTDSLEGCIDFLSDSDMLSAESRRGIQSSWTGAGRGASGYGSTVDNMLQDEISFQVAVRGLLFSLPYPVNRRLTQGPRSRPGDAHKMFYPSSLRLWRQTEERSGELDMWMRRLLEPSSAISAIGRGSSEGSKSEGVESWVNRGVGSGHAGLEDQADLSARATLMSRDEVLLQTLPYMVRILGHVGAMKDLEDLTQFHGIEAEPVDVEDELDGLDDVPIEPVVSARSSSTLRRERWPKQPNSEAPEQPPIEDTVEKLVLSDDDIEDD
ncbi:hypothetical protein DTO166G4_5144 [Paecilomyces variotii]|nr:hypothetical protein DTO166G4_5144 [Paecilomyces variotii]KAJ9229349.1 hypothetical protein DTO166G5_7931 [Paecilomyces variotii]KAJ9251104.1 hypothetical protein DTO207G8_5657 [Paecilomyces variotii]KAJ9366677.1 hypothetical protein DTO282E5_8632 [Paecilomyces variotii]